MNSAEGVRDSNPDAAKDFFSKELLYQALLQANKYLSDSSNYEKFVEAKRKLGAQSNTIASWLKDFDKPLDKADTRMNDRFLDHTAFPMFRLPKDQWEQFYGGYDIYNKLVLHIKQRRESMNRYFRFLEQKKKKEDKSKGLENQPKFNPSATNFNEGRFSNSSLAVLEDK